MRHNIQWSCLKGLGWLQLASRCLRALIGTSSEQQLDRELGIFLHAWLVWGDSGGGDFLFGQTWVFDFFHSNCQGLAHRQLCCRTCGHDDLIDLPTAVLSDMWTWWSDWPVASCAVGHVNMMIWLTCLQFKNQCLLLKLLVFVKFLIFVNFA